MASHSISNPEANSNTLPDSKRSKKRRRIATENQAGQLHNSSSTENQTRWKSTSEQQIYSSRLVEALRQSRSRTSSAPATGNGVRKTAYRVLAAAAKGRTRWSRAILTNGLRLRQQHKKQKVKVTGGIRSRKPVVKKRLPVLQRKVKVLGRLVPGCRKLSFPNLLEEATDYIAALEMQVRAMAALAGLFTRAEAEEADTSDRLGSNLS